MDQYNKNTESREEMFNELILLIQKKTSFVLHHRDEYVFHFINHKIDKKYIYIQNLEFWKEYLEVHNKSEDLNSIDRAFFIEEKCFIYIEKFLIKNKYEAYILSDTITYFHNNYCLYCNIRFDQGKIGEHVFPSYILTTIKNNSALKNKIVPIRSFSVQETNNRDFSILNVCSDCNNGFLSKIDNNISLFIKELIELSGKFHNQNHIKNKKIDFNYIDLIKLLSKIIINYFEYDYQNKSMHIDYPNTLYLMDFIHNIDYISLESIDVRLHIIKNKDLVFHVENISNFNEFKITLASICFYINFNKNIPSLIPIYILRKMNYLKYHQKNIKSKEIKILNNFIIDSFVDRACRFKVHNSFEFSYIILGENFIDEYDEILIGVLKKEEFYLMNKERTNIILSLPINEINKLISLNKKIKVGFTKNKIYLTEGTFILKNKKFFDEDITENLLLKFLQNKVYDIESFDFDIEVDLSIKRNTNDYLDKTK